MNENKNNALAEGAKEIQANMNLLNTVSSCPPASSSTNSNVDRKSTVGNLFNPSTAMKPQNSSVNSKMENGPEITRKEHNELCSTVPLEASKVTNSHDRIEGQPSTAIRKDKPQQLNLSNSLAGNNNDIPKAKTIQHVTNTKAHAVTTDSPKAVAKMSKENFPVKPNRNFVRKKSTDFTNNEETSRSEFDKMACSTNSSSCNDDSPILQKGETTSVACKANINNNIKNYINNNNNNSIGSTKVELHSSSTCPCGEGKVSSQSDQRKPNVMTPHDHNASSSPKKSTSSNSTGEKSKVASVGTSTVEIDIVPDANNMVLKTTVLRTIELSVAATPMCSAKASQTDFDGVPYSSECYSSPILSPSNKGKKPGPKIMTNASIKPRTESGIKTRIASVDNSSTDTTGLAMKTEKISAPLPTTKIGELTCSPVKRHIQPSSNSPYSSKPRSLFDSYGMTEHSMNDPSNESANSQRFTANSENIQHTPHPEKRHMAGNSPIVSGPSSERTRRRLLYDYKVQKDYPELFGITPRDRRSFIKRLAEKESPNGKGLIAPYYYWTGSPLPVPRMLTKLSQKSSSQTSLERKRDDLFREAILKDFSPFKMAINNAHDEDKDEQDDPVECSSTHQHVNSDSPSCSTHSKMSEKERATVELVHHNGTCTVDLEEDSDELSVLHDIRTQIQRRRSPEESSNDSGISDEMTTEKSGKNHGDEMPDGTTIKESSEVTSCKQSLLSAQRGEHQVAGKRNTNTTAHAANTSCQAQTYSKLTNTDSFLEGTSPNPPSAPVETMVVLKVDKGIGTEEDEEDFYRRVNMESTPQQQQQKCIKSLLAERRQAFFLNNRNLTYNNKISYHTCFASSPASSAFTALSQYSSSSSSSHCCPQSRFNSSATSIDLATRSPLKVRILDGEPLRSTMNNNSLEADSSSSTATTTSPYERVMYTRLEREKTARLERVDSSDDSTTSDPASASPALENATTDPSWSSSTGSLTGYSSSREDTATCLTTTTTPGGATCSSSSVAHQSSYEKAMNNQVVLPNTSCSAGDCITSPPTKKPNNCSHSSGNHNVNKFEDYVPNQLPRSRNFTFSKKGPDIVVTQGTPPENAAHDMNGYSSTDEEHDSVVVNRSRNCAHQCSTEDEQKEPDYEEEEDHLEGLKNTGGAAPQVASSSGTSGRNFLRVSSNDSTVENYGDDDDYNLEDEDDEDLSHCSVATINRYGTFESLEKLEDGEEGGSGGISDFPKPMPRSKARFTFEDDDDEDDDDWFDDDLNSDFSLRYPSQIQDNTYCKWFETHFPFIAV